MRMWLASVASQGCRIGKIVAGAVAVIALTTCAFGQSSSEVGGEANLKLPDLSQVNFLGMDGHRLLLIGILFCVFGLGFGLVIYTRLKNLPVHRAMREISELIYETCKTYLITQGKFLLLLWAFIAVVIILYFGVLLKYEAMRVVIILMFSVVGIAGSYGVAWFGIRVNTFANSRTAFASLGGKPYPIYRIPLEAGMSIGMMLISVELLIMLFILLGVKEPTVQVQLLVWIFVMRVMMLVASAVAYFLNGAIAKARYGHVQEMNFEAPLTSLVWITSLVSIVLTYIISSLIIPQLGGDPTQWWKLASIISCGTLAAAIIPEL